MRIRAVLLPLLAGVTAVSCATAGRPVQIDVADAHSDRHRRERALRAPRRRACRRACGSTMACRATRRSRSRCGTTPPFRSAVSQLGFARADLVDAGMIANPVLSLLFPVGPSSWKPRCGGPPRSCGSVRAGWRRPAVARGGGAGPGAVRSRSGALGPRRLRRPGAGARSSGAGERGGGRPPAHRHADAVAPGGRRHRGARCARRPRRCRPQRPGRRACGPRRDHRARTPAAAAGACPATTLR